MNFTRARIFAGPEGGRGRKAAKIKVAFGALFSIIAPFSWLQEKIAIDGMENGGGGRSEIRGDVEFNFMESRC
jgi:hypothetical protein